jgi:hypothetical protein
MAGKGKKPEQGRNMKKHFAAPYWKNLEERKKKEAEAKKKG